MVVKLSRLVLAAGAAVAFGGLAVAQIVGGVETPAFRAGTGGLAGSQGGSLNAVPMVFGPAGGWAREAPSPGMCSTRYYSFKETGCLRSNWVGLGNMTRNPTMTTFSYTNICPYAVRFRNDDYGKNRWTEARLMVGFAAYDFYPGDTRYIDLPREDEYFKDRFGIAKCNAPPRPKMEALGAGTWVGKACGTIGFKYQCDNWRFVFTANGGFSMSHMSGNSAFSNSGRWRQDGETVVVNLSDGTYISLKLRGGVLTGSNMGPGAGNATWEMRRQ
jgi:hypothetical protein